MVDKEKKGVIVGIDIGSTKICAVAGVYRPEIDKVELIGMIEEPTRKGLVVNGAVVNLEYTARALDSILTKLAIKANININNVIVNISGDDVEGKTHQGFITREDNRKTIQREEIEKLAIDIRKSFRATAGNVIIHTLPQDFLVDRDVTPHNPVGRYGVTLGGNFFLISTPHEPHLALRHTIEKVGIKQQNVTAFHPLTILHTLFSPLADSLSILNDKDREAGCAVVNIGSDTTEIAVFYENGLRHIAVIPFAGKSITNDLMRAFQIQFEDATTLKIIMGSILPNDINPNDIIKIPGEEGLPDREIVAKNVSIIIEERLKELAAMVMAELHISGHADNLFRGIMLTGGTANIEMIKDVFTLVTEKTVRIGNPYKNSFIETTLKELENPEYSTVVGLLLSGFYDLDDRVPSEVIWGEIASKQPQKPIVKPIPVVEPPKPEPEPEPEREKESIWDLFAKKIRLKDNDFGDMNGYTN